MTKTFGVAAIAVIAMASPAGPPTAGLTYDAAGSRHVAQSSFTHDLSALAGARGGTTPGVPEALRISSGPYAGFNFCSQDALPVTTATDPTFAASPPISVANPRLRATFEVARPGEPAFLTVNRAIENGRVYIFQAPLGTLANGDYRWRLRAEEGRTVSAWTPWCNFKVSLAQQ